MLGASLVHRSCLILDSFSPMDCKRFRKLHLAYLDDTLSGDDTTEAQRHILACDRCAAHDTMVRRSLLLARNIPVLEPSAEFRERLRVRLDACKCDNESLLVSGTHHHSRFYRSPRFIAVIATSVAIGTVVWNGTKSASTPIVAMRPVMAQQPALPQRPVVSPALMQAMATGNPVWPAALILDEVPTQLVNTSYGFADEVR